MNLEKYVILDLVRRHLHFLQRVLKMRIPVTSSIAGTICIHDQIPDRIVASGRADYIHKALSIIIDRLICTCRQFGIIACII